LKIYYAAIITFTLLLFSNSFNGQSWTELNPPPNIFNDAIHAIATDSIGVIYAAGKFKNINNKFIVARWKAGTWAEVENGTDSLKGNNPIFGLAVDKNGNLYAAGAFTNTSGNYYVAKWNDSTWSQLGIGTNALNPNGSMYTVATDNTNNVYVAGGFTNTSGKQYVAKWNGISWSELGSGANALNANGIIYSVGTDAFSNVYAAGHFTNANGKYYVAKWNGTSWSELGTGINALDANDYINCIKIDNAGNVYAAGAFRNSSAEYYVAKYNGSSWSEVGSGINALHANGTINSMVITNTGTIYAGGFGTNINGATNVVKWNGINWNEIFNVGGAINNSVRAITIDSSGNVYAGGDFKNVNNHNYVAKWDGVIMKELGRQGEFLPAHNSIQLTKADVYGNVYAIGIFSHPNLLKTVAKWDGIGWKELTNINPPYVEGVEALTTDSLGNVYVGGHFTNQNGEYFVAKWDGTNWIELISSTSSLHATGFITSLNTDSSGNIYATGFFEENGIGYGIAKWDGINWTKFGSTPGNSIRCLVQGPSTSVYVTGVFTNNSSHYYVANVDSNGAWNEVGTAANALKANNQIKSIAIDDNGNLYAGGIFFNSIGERYVAKWNGTNWSQLDTIPDITIVYAVAADTAGNVFASVRRSSISDYYIAKWNGSIWTELDGDNHYNFNGDILSLHKDHKENFYAAGGFGNEAGNNFVAALGKSILILKKPLLSSSPNQYCNTAGTQTIKILNLPDTSRVHVLAKLDNTTLTINADSTFSFNTPSLTAGNHRITVFFYIGADSMYTIKDFVIIPAVTPDVNISASTTVVNSLNPVTVTATNAAGGGISPLFTFAKDRTITTILQAESSNNVMNLDPTILSVGDNWIYVRMKTSNTCYTSQANIDSINIVRSAATGITDIDFPDQQIYVYPNPFQQSITIRGLQISKSYSISLVNLLGQVIFQKDVRNRTDLTINQNVSTGFYWLKIYDKTKKRSLGVEGLIKH
jgi:hypothetical protein